MRSAGRLLVLLFLVAFGAGCAGKGSPTSDGVPPLPSSFGKSGGSNAPPPSHP
jgi:hypothetical protein